MNNKSMEKGIRRMKGRESLMYLLIISFLVFLFFGCEFLEPEPLPDPTSIPTAEPSPESTPEPTPIQTGEPTAAPTDGPTPTNEIIGSLQTYMRGFCWSPDSTSLALTVSPFGDPWNCDIWVVNKELTSIHIIKTGEVANIYGWEGDWILFDKDKGEGLPGSYTGEGEFWKIRSNGTEETQLTYTYTNGIRTEFWNHSYDNIGTAVWTGFVPGTDLVYFLAHDGNGWYRSYTCHADGTDNWADISYPDHTWTIDVSPTGNKLFFASSSNYNTDFTFKLATPDGSGVTAVKGPMARCNYTLLPDGSGIAWELNNMISVINNDGTNERVVLNDMDNNTLLTHGRNNELLIRSDRSDGNSHLYSLHCTTSAVTQLTSGEFNDNTGHVSPDELYLAYIRLSESYSGTTTVPYYELVVQNMN